MEYGNGVIGDMCIHMIDLVRWTLDLGWPSVVHSTGGIFVDKDSKANTPDTQTATFSFPDLNVVWTHRNWGPPVYDDYPWAYFIYGEKGLFKGSTRKWEFIPVDKSEKPILRQAPTEMGQVRDRQFRHCRFKAGSSRVPRLAGAHEGLPQRHRQSFQARRRH